MALSNKLNALPTTQGKKEIVVGYCSEFMEICGGLAESDLPKMGTH